MKRTLIALLSSALACHHAGEARILERGGESLHLEQTNLVVTHDAITAWGVIEVPDGARLQAAYAGADALARAELLKFLRVRIADVMVSVDSTDPARRDAYEHTVESVAGSLRHAGTAQHSWERVQQASDVILRVWSRLTVPRADVDAALQQGNVSGGVVDE